MIRRTGCISDSRSFVWAVETQPLATVPVRVPRTGEDLTCTRRIFANQKISNEKK